MLLRISSVTAARMTTRIVTAPVVQATTVAPDAGPESNIGRDMTMKETNTASAKGHRIMPDLPSMKPSPVGAWLLVEVWLWLASLFLAACALLCWSASSLFNAVIVGFNLDMAYAHAAI